MTDIALAWNAEAMAADLVLDQGQLLADQGLRTAVMISLFTDARAPDDAALPEAGQDRRGWWGDVLATDAGPMAGSAADPDRIGSLLWLLSRAKVTPAVLAEAREHAEAALAWLVRDGVARAVRVIATAERAGAVPDVLALAVEIDRPDGPGRQRWDFTWDASTRSIMIKEPN